MFIFDETSDTIRQMPENYVIMTRIGMRWVVDPDKAMGIKLATKVFELVFSEMINYSRGDALALKLNNAFYTLKH